MMKRSKNSSSDRLSDSSSIRDEEIEWEMRPGGMLVQKRCTKPDAIATPNMIVKIAYGAVRYEISINSQATFGELKKLLASETGLQPVEQQLIFRGKGRENGNYLDKCGVKDRSKIVLVEDPSSKEKRYIEMRRNAKIQSAHRAISDISMELDKLAEQVSTIDKIISSGKNVPEVQITILAEMLMRQAIKLESISAEGDASAQKSLQ
ncbi:Bag family molecular chaperone regulator, partial [Thalictrum thalictroides]